MNIELFIFFVFVLLIPVYCIHYIIKKEKMKEIYIILEDIFYETYQFSMDLLTKSFLFVFYSELIIKKLFISHFSVAEIINKNPSTVEDVLVGIIVIVTILVVIFYWSNKVPGIAVESIKNFKCENAFVKLNINFMMFMIVLLYQFLVLMPVFTYGISGNFGNPDFLK